MTSTSTLSVLPYAEGTLFDTVAIVAWTLYGVVAVTYAIVFHLPPSRYYGPAMFWKPGVVVVPVTDHPLSPPTRIGGDAAEGAGAGRRLTKRYPHTCCSSVAPAAGGSGGSASVGGVLGAQEPSSSAANGGSGGVVPSEIGGQMVYSSPPIARRWSHVIVNTAQINAIQTLRGPVSLCALYGPGLMQMLSFLYFVDNFLNEANSDALAVLIFCVSIVALVFFVQAMRMIYQLNYLVMVLPQKPRTRDELASEAIGIGVGIHEHTDAELSRQQRHAEVALDVIRDATSSLMNVAVAASNSSGRQPPPPPNAVRDTLPSADASVDSPPAGSTEPATSAPDPKPSPSNAAVRMEDGIQALRDAASRRGYTMGILRDTHHARSSLVASRPPPSSSSTEPFHSSSPTGLGAHHHAFHFPSRVTVGELAVVNMLTSPSGAGPANGAPFPAADDAAAAAEHNTPRNSASSAPSGTDAMAHLRFRAAALRRVGSGFLSSDALHARNDDAESADVTAQLLRHLAIEEAFSVQQHEDRLTLMVQLMSWNLSLGMRCLMFLLPPVLGMFGGVPFLVSTCCLPALLWYVDHQW